MTEQAMVIKEFANGTRTLRITSGGVAAPRDYRLTVRMRGSLATGLCPSKTIVADGRTIKALAARGLVKPLSGHLALLTDDGLLLAKAIDPRLAAIIWPA